LEADPDGAGQKLAAPAFANCVLVTPFNKAVFQFAIHRAQNFAAATGQQLFWMQAIDNPPAWFAGSMSKSELEEMKQTWLQYHAKKTEGILSLCPCCYDMPMRVTNGSGYMSKNYGIHNGAQGVLKAWQFADSDVEAANTAASQQVVLHALPKRLVLKMSRPMTKQYPGMEKDCFPLAPVTVYWNLDMSGDIQICRRGFPVVPNFSMTVDSATGKTLDTEIGDLGDITEKSTFKRAMKGYITLSRVKKAQDLYLPRPFSPALFKQGEQPWPSFILLVLKGKEYEGQKEGTSWWQLVAQRVQDMRGGKADLAEMCWPCARASCRNKKEHAWDLFLPQGLSPSTDAWFRAYWSNIIAPGDERVCQECKDGEVVFFVLPLLLPSPPPKAGRWWSWRSRASVILALWVSQDTPGHCDTQGSRTWHSIQPQHSESFSIFGCRRTPGVIQPKIEMLV